MVFIPSVRKFGGIGNGVETEHEKSSFDSDRNQCRTQDAARRLYCMNAEERQFLLTAAWLFVRHGQPARARALVEALVEADPRDGVSAAALAELMLAGHEGFEALKVLRAADFPPELARAEAVLETRALAMVGRAAESTKRWRRFLESRKGKGRSWIAQ